MMSYFNNISCRNGGNGLRLCGEGGRCLVNRGNKISMSVWLKDEIQIQGHRD